mmetsp:Transcript_28585/g.80575  ORF Transcript_28585/g.80575 Transcript_28585/m.80575 type:complete len:238 (-) Transcript_28585:672-1385(-)
MWMAKKRHTTPAQTPRKTAPTGPTKPAHGVMVARPAMEPVAMPSMLALPFITMSCSDHTAAAVAAASCVARQANAASAEAVRAEPPLNPYQPTQSIPVPRTVRRRFPVTMRLSLRGPRTAQPTKAPMPAVMCTTMPPAKSRTPWAAMKPFGPHTMWQAGKYTANIHRTQYHITALNFMRSTKLPTIRAGVMMAKVIWYSAHRASGMVSHRLVLVMPARNDLSRPPMTELPISLKLRE